METTKITPEDLYRSTMDFIYEKIPMYELHSLYVKFSEQKPSYLRGCTRYLLQRFQDILYAFEGNFLYYYIVSFLVSVTRDRETLKDFIAYSIADEKIIKETKYYLYRYFLKLLFLGEVPRDRKLGNLMDQLYEVILDAYAVELPYELSKIPRQERNEDLIFVFTTQMLSMVHGPTKTALDRSYVLSKNMQKKVFLINTAEMTITENEIILFTLAQGTYFPEYSSYSSIAYQDASFLFHQCPKGMPISDNVAEIVDVVQKEKPLCIITIGGDSIVSDLCSRIVPTITVGTVPSGRSQTYGQFQTIGRKVTEEDLQWAGRHGLPADHFIESLFTSSFKPQEYTFKRSDLNLPEDGFVVLLVGARLDAEVDEECLNLLLRLVEQGIYLAFMGVFSKYKQLAANYPAFRDYAIDMGFQEDAMAVYECCDLYLNPKRVGGGTSVAEALYKGVPVVTLDYGVGGLGAGTDFHVKDYEDMYNTICSYKTDRNYYREMSEKARARAELLTDSAGQFMKVMDTAMSREEFQ